MKLRPVFNRRLGQWVICHDLLCERGETSIVATVTTSLFPDADQAIASAICDGFNLLPDNVRRAAVAAIGRSECAAT